MKTSAVALAALLVTGAYADTVIPANDVEALTNAVNAATAGQVIEVSAGTYLLTEPMTLPAKHFVVLKGATGDPKDVIFDGGDKINILTISSGAKSNLVSGITFRNCRNSIQGGYGGGMQSAGAAIRMSGHNDNVNTGTVISNCVFNGCHSDTGWGGAILMPGGTTVAGCVFTNCTSQMKGSDYSTAYGGSYGGGAIYAVAKVADVLIKDTAFLNCGCSNGVGVINCGYFASVERSDQNYPPYGTNHFGVTVLNCGFTNNWSYGSSACLNLKVRHVEGCSFKGNITYPSKSFSKSAAIKGKSAILCAENGDCGTSQRYYNTPTETNRFISCRFEENEGGSMSAIFYHEGNVPLVVSNCYFKANCSDGEGSLFYTTGPVELKDSVFEENYSVKERTGTGPEYNGYGLMIFKSGRPAHVHRCDFFRNRTMGGSGLVKTCGKHSEIIDCTFSANIADRAGFPSCPVHVDSATATDILVRGCLFSCNTNKAGNTGAQIYLGLGNPGSNPLVGGTNAVIESCTFVGNRSNNANWNGSNAGTVYIANSGGTAQIRNCVFYDNKSIGGATGIRNFAYGGTGEGCYKLATYCWEDGSLVPTAAEKHNIRGSNPKFRDAAHGDYVPGPGSALKGNGLFCDWMTAAVDLAGNPRSPDGKVDIGCYEHIRTGLMLFVR